MQFNNQMISGMVICTYETNSMKNSVLKLIFLENKIFWTPNWSQTHDLMGTGGALLPLSYGRLMVRKVLN